MVKNQLARVDLGCPERVPTELVAEIKDASVAPRVAPASLDDATPTSLPWTHPTPFVGAVALRLVYSIHQERFRDCVSARGRYAPLKTGSRNNGLNVRKSFLMIAR